MTELYFKFKYREIFDKDPIKAVDQRVTDDIGKISVFPDDPDDAIVAPAAAAADCMLRLFLTINEN